MVDSIQAVKGMRDALPDETPRWRFIDSAIRRVMERYGYREMRLPLLERTELFARSIGETSDIVTKEMYTFTDRGGDSLTLRPEGTAGCVRAGIEHGLLAGGAARLWYSGPMFRRERPQKGRFRQFHQAGAEVFGCAGPDVDAELICMTARLWSELGIDGVRLEINSLGDDRTRAQYRAALVEYFGAHRDRLDDASRRRLETNPLRLLDSKDADIQALVADAPGMDTYLDAESRAHFEELRALLDSAGISCQCNSRLVRGLDYYNRTVFEWITDRLGAQGTICGGGRYDGLVRRFGGSDVPAAGFAIGLERLLELVPDSFREPDAPHVYLIAAGPAARRAALHTAERLRTELPALRLTMHSPDASMKSQFKRADRSGAAVALIFGESEVEQGRAGIKALREDSDQTAVPLDELAAHLRERLGL